MAPPSGKGLPVGLRYVQVIGLNSNYLPDATSTSPYEGLNMDGPKAFTRNIPDARMITHEGGDGVEDVDMLPPSEAPTGELRASWVDFNLLAAITGVKVVTLGESKGIAVASSKLGFEPEMALFLRQQFKDDSGSRHWRAIAMPRARLHAKVSGMVAEGSDQVFQVMPGKVTKHIWGVAFTLATDGCTKAFFRDFHTQYFPWIVAWKGDNVATEFLFNADRPAVSINKIHGVWVNGTLDASATLAITGVTPTTKPASGDIIVSFLEIANPEEA